METKIKETYNLRAIEGLYREVHAYRTNLHFAQDEITFFDHLLKTYNFQPNTQNLFERLQLFERGLHKAKEAINVLVSRIDKHESRLGGLMESGDASLDHELYKSHDTLTADLNDFMATHHDLKTEIFNYIGGFLKKRKPQ